MGRFSELSKQDEGDNAIDISPLLDCVFILLIFFIVTTTFVEEEGIEVDKPQAAPQIIQNESESIVLLIKENGEVLYEGKNIGVGGIQPLVKRKMQHDDVPVIVQTEKKVPSGILVQVVDEANIAGATKVSVGSK